MDKCCSSALFLLIASACLPAQSVAKPRAPNPRVQVQCVDLNNKPVAGAEVHIWQHRPLPNGSGEMVPAGPFATDAKGTATTAIALTHGGGRFDRWVYARVPGKLVGAARALVVGIATDATAENAIEVQLQPSRSLRGSITAPQHSDLSTVRVRVIALNGIVGDNLWAQPFPRQSSITSLRNTSPERFECEVNADGTFELADIPQRALIYLAAEGPGLAQSQWFNALLPDRTIPDSISLTMQAECTYSGTVLSPDGTPCNNAKIALRIQRVPNAGVRDTFTVTCDAQGTFQLAGLPAGELILEVTSQAGLLRPAALQLKPMERLSKQTLRLEHGVTVSGIVTEQGSDKPVEGAGLSAISGDVRNLPLGFAKTNALGRFTMRLPSGPARLYFSMVPKGFTHPSSENQTVFDVDRDNVDMTGFTFELSRKQ